MKLNAMFSFFWNATAEANLRVTKAQELSKSYPKYLKVDAFVRKFNVWPLLGAAANPQKILATLN